MTTLKPQLGVNVMADESWKAWQQIRAYVRKTPLDFSPWLSQQANCNCFLKLESEQVTGSFKARGAVHKMMCLSTDELQKGVITASTGNHALAFTYACQVIHGPSLIPKVYLPVNASKSKIKKLLIAGAQLEYFGQDSVQTETKARQVAQSQNQTFISPYNDLQIVGGQGTMGIELLEQIKEMSVQLDYVFVPVGGGGLIAGVASLLKSLKPEIRVVGCQPSNSDVMRKSVAAGKVLEVPSLETLSDGTAGGVELNTITLKPCTEFVDEWVSVDEDEIALALMQFIQYHSKLIEGSAAMTLASFLKIQHKLAGKNIAIICCGGNISLETLRSVLCQKVNNYVS